jgi:hypothetical protein
MARPQCDTPLGYITEQEKKDKKKKKKLGYFTGRKVNKSKSPSSPLPNGSSYKVVFLLLDSTSPRREMCCPRPQLYTCHTCSL